jgi:hypothetical protein
MTAPHAKNNPESLQYRGALVREVMTLWKHRGTKRELFGLIHRGDGTQRIFPNGSVRLAFVLLADALGSTDIAWKYHRKFCLDVINALDLKAWELDRATIRSWYKSHLTPPRRARRGRTTTTTHDRA